MKDVIRRLNNSHVEYFDRTISHQIELTIRRCFVITTIIFALTIGGCNSVPTNGLNGLEGAVSSGLSSLVLDLKAADADALAHKDTIADTCYKAEIAFIQTSMPEHTASTLGPVQVFQIKRDVLNSLTDNGKTSLKVSCAPLWLDEQQQFARFTAVLASIGIVIPK